MIYFRKSISTFILIFTIMNIQAQQVIKLWDETPPPTDNGITQNETYDKESGWMENISVPTITIYSPPAILLLSDDDPSVPPSNSTSYYEALKANGIPAAMYIFPEGGHGWGMRKDFKYNKLMLSLLSHWLEDIQDKQ